MTGSIHPVVSEPTVRPNANSIVRWLPWILFGLAVVILICGAWLRRHSLDDSFINYRIVHQIEAGNGPVFNAGERVEAFTSPLWLAGLVVGDEILPLDLAWIGMAGGIALGAIGLVFAGIGAWRLHHDDTAPHDAGSPVRWCVPLGALVVAVFPPIYRLIATGLEDGLTLAWLGACCWVLGAWSRHDRRFPLTGAFLIGLGVLVRPDVAPYCAVFLIAVLIGDRGFGRRRGLLLIGSAIALPVVTEILRMGYFGVLTPNTAIAKSAGLARWGRGWQYFLDTMNPYWFWVPAVIVIVVGYVPVLSRSVRRGRTMREIRRALVVGAFAVGALVCALYIIRLGGDYMQTRLLLPAIFGFVAPMSFVPWPSRFAVSGTPRGTGVALGGIAVVWLVVCGAFLRTPSDNRAVLFEPENAVTLADFAAAAPGPIAPRTEPGRVYYNGRQLPYASARGQTPIVITLGVGKVGYALENDVYLLDGLGLANPIAAHEKLRVRGWPGHEKLLTQPWMAALSTAPGSPVRAESFPRPPTMHTGSETIVIPDQGDARGRPFGQRVSTARDVLECATMRRFRASYQAPLTLHRFGSNIVHSFAHQRLVIPGEPAYAADALCTSAEQMDHARVRSPG